ncbi:unnamed protein product [Linum trigynum]|uniref:Uncharacterized protein n=1 Tax=Linum trigynum TaxID=586398 RepID=A0AAV2ETN6_9ROSI
MIEQNPTSMKIGAGQAKKTITRHQPIPYRTKTSSEAPKREPSKTMGVRQRVTDIKSLSFDLPTASQLIHKGRLQASPKHRDQLGKARR